MQLSDTRVATKEVSELACAALEYLEREISRSYWNNHQKEWESAFRNTGNSYFAKAFSVRAYDWTNEEDGVFMWRDVEVRWYKNLGRGTYSNIELTPALVNVMLNDCLEKIDERK